MKRVVILHGTDGRPDHNWFPWLKSQLEDQGYQVWVPLLPDNHSPNKDTYNNFLFNGDWDFTDNIIIGHSSGAVSVLNMLMDERCPKIKLGIMLGAWKDGLPNGYNSDSVQFDNLFPVDGFNFPLIKRKADKLIFMHGDDDPFCPLEQAQYLADKIGAPLIVVEGGHHLGSKFSVLPQLLEIIKHNS